MDASSIHEAGVAETSSPEAAALQDSGPVCSGGSWGAVFDSFHASAGNVEGLYEFLRRYHLLDWNRSIAVEVNLVDPTTGVLCTTVATCPYDPTLPRVSPQDVHHSDALGEYIGPDGRALVWTYYQPLNEYYILDRARNPQGYQTVVEFNAGCSAGCPCDAG
jgi:hypothetical protein